MKYIKPFSGISYTTDYVYVGISIVVAVLGIQIILDSLKWSTSNTWHSKNGRNSKRL